MNCETTSTAPPASTTDRFILPGFVFEDAQIPDLVREVRHVLGTITVLDADEREDARRDPARLAPVDDDARGRHSLEHGAHESWAC